MEGAESSACDGNWFGPCGMIEAEKEEEAKQWMGFGPGPDRVEVANVILWMNDGVDGPRSRLLQFKKLYE